MSQNSLPQTSESQHDSHQNWTNPAPPKPSKCNGPRCKTCPVSDRSLSFVHPVTHKTYSFRHSGSCISSNLVYLLLCNLCSAFYVGETHSSLTFRINNHRYSSKSQLSHLPIPEHTCYHGCTFDDTFRVRILKVLNPDLSQ